MHFGFTFCSGLLTLRAGQSPVIKARVLYPPLEISDLNLAYSRQARVSKVRLPGGGMSDHGVKNREQFAHASGQGHLLGLSRGT